MKQLLTRFLTDHQYRALAKFKNKTLPHLRYRLGQSPFLMAGSVVKLLPANSRVTVKSGMNIIRKMDYPRHEIYLNIESDLEFQVRLHSCQKEPDTVQWIETQLKAGDVLYDIGANVGAYSLVAAKFLKHKVKVYAFEPAFPNYAQLCRNLIINGCQECVVPLQIALSDQTGLEDFYYYSLVSGGAVHTLGESIDFMGEEFTPASTQPVMRFSVDDFIDRFNIPTPNHIKIDVDGTEFSILKGMARALEDKSMRSMILELTPGRGQGPEVLEFMSQKGFKVQSTAGLNHVLVRTE